MMKLVYGLASITVLLLGLFALLLFPPPHNGGGTQPEQGAQTNYKGNQSAVATANKNSPPKPTTTKTESAQGPQTNPDPTNNRGPLTVSTPPSAEDESRPAQPAAPPASHATTTPPVADAGEPSTGVFTWVLVEDDNERLQSALYQLGAHDVWLDPDHNIYTGHAQLVPEGVFSALFLPRQPPEKQSLTSASRLSPYYGFREGVLEKVVSLR